MKVLLATTNPGKLEDYRQFAAGTDLELVSLTDVGIDAEAPEGLPTFEENALSKAAFYQKLSGLPTFADDSGIEIDFYGGQPGVHTRDWDGVGKRGPEYFAFILEKVKAVPKDRRTAHFTAVLAYDDGATQHTAAGSLEVLLTDVPYEHSETVGYPWDKVTIIPEIGKYYEEVTEEENYRFNHRRRAFEEMMTKLNAAR